jgi:hypothetical protein
MVTSDAVTFLEQHTNDEQESRDSSPTPPTDFPSHARRQKPKQNGVFCITKLILFVHICTMCSIN